MKGLWLGFVLLCTVGAGLIAWGVLPVVARLAPVPAPPSRPVADDVPRRSGAAGTGAAREAEGRAAAAPTMERASREPTDALRRSPTDATAASPRPEPAPGGASTVRYPRDPSVRRWEAALDRADAALAGNPEHVPALRDRGAALCALGRHDEAAQTLARVVQLTADEPGDRLAYGAALARLGRWPAALEQYRALVERVPDDARAWHNLAVAHQALGHLNDARHAWDRAIELLEGEARPAAADRIDARARRGEVLADLGLWSEAAADFEAAHQADPDDAGHALNLALAWTRLGRFDDARRALAPLIERDGGVTAMNRMAELCWEEYTRAASPEESSIAEAAEWCRRSLGVRPDQPDVRKLLERLEAQRRSRVAPRGTSAGATP